MDIIRYSENSKISSHGKSVWADQRKAFPMLGQHRFYTKNADGGFSSSIMSDLSQAQFRIQAGSIGRIKQLFIAVGITVSNAAVQLTPSPFWCSLISFMKDAGNEELARLTPDQIFEYINTVYSQEEWEVYSNYFNMMIDGRANPYSQPVGTKWYLIPLPANVYNDIYNKYWKSDLNILLTFQNSIASGTAANTQISGGNLRLYALFDDVEPSLAKTITQRYSEGYEHKFLQLQNFTQTQTIAPGTQYNFLLNNLVGKCSYLWFVIRASKATAANAMLNFSKIGDNQVLGSAQLLDKDQSPIYNSNLTNDVFLAENGKHLSNAICRQYANQIYRFMFNEPKKLLLHGVYDKFLPMNGDITLQINLSSNTAETARVVTMTCGALGVGTNATRGSFQLVYNVPNHPIQGNLTYITPPLAFNSSAANTTSALAALGIPDITATVTQTFSANNAIIITVSGITSDKDYHTASKGASWSIISSLTTGAANLTVDVVDTTASVPQSGSLASGTYTIDVYVGEKIAENLGNSASCTLTGTQVVDGQWVNCSTGQPIDWKCSFLGQCGTGTNDVAKDYTCYLQKDGTYITRTGKQCFIDQPIYGDDDIQKKYNDWVSMEESYCVNTYKGQFGWDSGRGQFVCNYPDSKTGQTLTHYYNNPYNY